VSWTEQLWFDSWQGQKIFYFLHYVPNSQSPNRKVPGILILKIKWLGCDVITNLHQIPELRMNAAVPLLLPHTFMETMGRPLILHLQNCQYKNDTITGQPILLIGNNTLNCNNISLFDYSEKKVK
jgi:hypothetical protein